MVSSLKEFLKENNNDINALKTLFIKIKEYDDCYNLDYCQYNSPKTHPVVMDCRGTVLQKETLKVLCCPFKRFFNLGEVPDLEEDFDFKNCSIEEKADGTLIKVYFNNGWKIGTRGTAFAEGDVTDTGMTYNQKFIETLGITNHQFQELFDKVSFKSFEVLKDTLSNLQSKEDFTFLFEYCSLENRIVTLYEVPTIKFLGMNTNFGEIVNIWKYEEIYDIFISFEKSIICLSDTVFLKKEDIVKQADALPNLQEGFVLVDYINQKRLKVKSKQYVTIHLIRGESILTNKRTFELIFENNYQEFLTYFPEYSKTIYDKIDFINSTIQEYQTIYDLYKDIPIRKDFALKVKDLNNCKIYFNSYLKNISVKVSFEQFSTLEKINFFKNEMNYGE